MTWSTMIPSSKSSILAVVWGKTGGGKGDAVELGGMFVCVCVSPSPEGSRRRSADGRSPPGPAGSPGAVRGMLGQRPAPELLPEPPRRSGHPSPGAPGVLPALPRGGLGVFPCAAPQKFPPRGSPKLSHPGGILGTPPLKSNRGAPPDSVLRGWGAPIPLPHGWGCFPGPAPLGTPRVGSISAPLRRGRKSRIPSPWDHRGKTLQPFSLREPFPCPPPLGTPRAGGKEERKAGGSSISAHLSPGSSLGHHSRGVGGAYGAPSPLGGGEEEDTLRLENPRGGFPGPCPLRPARAVLTSRNRGSLGGGRGAERCGAGRRVRSGQRGAERAAALSRFPFNRSHRPACVCGTGRVLRPLLL